MLNGYSKCSAPSTNETNECTITCEEGYGFASEEPNVGIVENILLLKCNGNTSNWLEENYIPDCSGLLNVTISLFDLTDMTQFINLQINHIEDLQF